MTGYCRLKVSEKKCSSKTSVHKRILEPTSIDFLISFSRQEQIFYFWYNGHGCIFFLLTASAIRGKFIGTGCCTSKYNDTMMAYISGEMYYDSTSLEMCIYLGSAFSSFFYDVASFYSKMKLYLCYYYVYIYCI